MDYCFNLWIYFLASPKEYLLSYLGINDVD